MSKDIDLTEILKNCPLGAKFYSYIFGEDTYFMGVSSIQGDTKPIFICGKYGEGENFCLSRKGHAYADNYGECCIFPSKEQRDWSKFTATWLNKERFDPKTLSPFDRVLARNHGSHRWTCDLFSDIIDGDECMYHCIDSYYRYCIPYNDETKHLVDTKEEAPDFYKYWED